MIDLMLVVLAATVVVSVLTITGFSRLPTLRLQLAALAIFASAVPIVSITVGGFVMFDRHEALMILVVLAGAALAPLGVALLLARLVVARVDATGQAAGRLAAGDLGSRAPVVGPRELAALSASFNEMAENIARLFDARRQLVAWASHDLRTPLTSIQAMLEALAGRTLRFAVDGIRDREEAPVLPAAAVPEQAHAVASLRVIKRASG